MWWKMKLRGQRPARPIMAQFIPKNTVHRRRHLLLLLLDVYQAIYFVMALLVLQSFQAFLCIKFDDDGHQFLLYIHTISSPLIWLFLTPPDWSTRLTWANDNFIPRLICNWNQDIISNDDEELRHIRQTFPNCLNFWTFAYVAITLASYSTVRRRFHVKH